jgi:hypothetical protein
MDPERSDPLFPGIPGPDSGELGMEEQIIRRMGEQMGFDMDSRDVGRFLEYERRSIEQAQMAPEREMISRAMTPEQVTWAVREFVDKSQDSIVKAPMYVDRYSQLGMYWQLINKATSIELGLEKNKNVLKYLGFEEIGVNSHRMLPELTGYQEMEIPEDADDKQVKRIENWNKIIAEQKTKNKELLQLAESQRESLAKELRSESAYLASQAKFFREFDQYESTGGSVDEIAKGFLVPTSLHVQSWDLATVFRAGPKLKLRNGEAASQFKERSEARHWGDDVDKAMRAYYIIGLCERPKELKALKETPGWKLLFPTLEEERMWLGDINRWTEVKRTEEMYSNEFEDGKRGSFKFSKEQRDVLGIGDEFSSLTKFGNKWAHKENTKERNELRAVVTAMVGGNKSAEEFAYRFFRLSGMAAKFGGETYWDGSKKTWVYAVEGFPAGSDDLTKMTVTREHQLKDSMSGHPIGPHRTRGKLEKVVDDFFTFATPIKDIAIMDNRSERIKKAKRTIKELWWGYSDEKAHKLSEIDWESYPPEIWRDHKLRIFFGGRSSNSAKGLGFYQKWTKVGWDPRDLMQTEFWEQVNKDLNVLVGDTFVANGNLKRYDGKKDVLKSEVEETKKRIKKLFSDGILYQRENEPWVNNPGLKPGESTIGSIEIAQLKAGYN